MKKLFTILCSLTFVGAGATQIVACTSKPKLKIVFVPSQDASKTDIAIKKLQNALPSILSSKVKGFNYKVEIYSSTNYEAAGESLSQGKDAIAFLPIGTYTSYRGDQNNDGTFSKLGLLANVGREALIPEVNIFKDKLKNTNELNVVLQTPHDFETSYEIVKSYYNVKDNKQKELDSATNTGEKKWTKDSISKTFLSKEYIAPYYRSLIYANKNMLNDSYTVNGQSFTYKENFISSKAKHVEAVFHLIDNNKSKVHFSKSLTSSAGTIYPLMYMYNLAIEKGLSAKEAEAWVASIYKVHQQQSDYNHARKLASTGKNITVGFGDIRTDELNVPDEVMRNVEVIGAGNPIQNDGIQYSRTWFNGKDELLSALRQSFAEMIKDEKYADIFAIYNHKNYLIPEKGKEKEWEINIDKSISNVVYDPIYEKIKEIVVTTKG